MKRIFLLSAALGAVFTFSYCKSKKAATTSAPVDFTRQMAVASQRWPGVIETDLREGHTIYTTKCTRCHDNFEVTKFTEAKWLHEIDEMAPRAELTPGEKEKLTRHILSARQVFASAQAK